jgi:hypothetical protein
MITECERRNNEDSVHLEKKQAHDITKDSKETGLESCPVVGLGNSGAERSGCPSSY